MRNQFVSTVAELMTKDDRIMVLLGDIGVWQFRHAAEKYPGHVLNCGISEQAMVGMAAGLAKAGMVPIVHSIAPFLVERAYEQIKLDLGHNGLKAILVSVGASFDYHAEGVTHHCPADVALMYQVPGMRIHLPADKYRLHHILAGAVNEPDGNSHYIRLSSGNWHVWFDEIHADKEPWFTVITVGPIVLAAQQAFAGWPLDFIHYDTVVPFDGLRLARIRTKTAVLIEPYYPVLTEEVLRFLPEGTRLVSIGVSRKILHESGSLEKLETEAGISAQAIRERCEEFAK
jgi:transketolase